MREKKKLKEGLKKKHSKTPYAITFGSLLITKTL
jgi:hypothetical protein